MSEVLDLNSSRKKKPRKKRTYERSVRATSLAYARKEELTTRIVISIISLMVIVLAIGTMYSRFTREIPPSMHVELMTVVGSDFSHGIIIREEQAYASLSGDVNFSVSNNARVRQDDIIATVSSSSVAPLIEENEQLATQILSLQSLRTPISMHTHYIDTINGQIREVTNNNLHRIGDLAFARHFADQINTHVDTRNNLLLSENIGSLEQYVNQSVQNINIISDRQSQVRASQGGIVSFSVDGFEHLAPDNMLHLTPQFFYLSGTGAGDFKIVTSNTWYIAAFLDNVRAAHLTHNMHTTIFAEDGEGFRELSATVNTLENRGEYTLVIFSIRDFMLDYIEQRTVKFKLDNAMTTGLRVRESAVAIRTLLPIPMEYVHKDEDNYYITIVSEGANTFNTVRIRPITIRGHQTTDGYVYVLQDFGNIQLGTTIALNGQEYTISGVVSDTGVFRVNNGVATFTSVDTYGMIEYESENYRYFILNTELNRGGIMVHDRIISDTQNYLVYEGQIVH